MAMRSVAFITGLLKRGSIIGMAALALFATASLNAAHADIPPCAPHEDPEHYRCKIYADDPFGVWESEVEQELLGIPWSDH
ncbi:hypothetical protein BKG82_15285 [Mycobacteroides chelonae]|jgi:hypothetical protein|uniref:Uncharacterized protein n=3 Tax=Mycobacteriaceae TaxID=1762 RepID=A0A1S1LIG7_MYCCH|nr:hypothetical protein AOT87_06595 [Mycobacteroides sp. H003]KRQ36313.1 hypothetical protein AOT91_03555 [Mycobacteroides sp. H092]KRQ39169.1 hypothetical protein AOT92_17785 [Mycobacteroides sp. H101]KRQ48547.1 hypothetical protein AOT88_12595 [Mycobacteroides sp. H063]KRQ58903.1 hypothetical protein AOT94_11790 [Mycobacteroides sp. HXVII]KRQ60543.1 hypothetical protein AOT90_20165 [Mycobacteroides sp. H079]KRQ71231.1 hypothetical protein AOT89_10420 [Mycobacteroides sp. H070]KRQ77326.1 hy